MEALQDVIETPKNYSWKENLYYGIGIAPIILKIETYNLLFLITKKQEFRKKTIDNLEKQIQIIVKYPRASIYHKLVYFRNKERIENLENKCGC